MDDRTTCYAFHLDNPSQEYMSCVESVREFDAETGECTYDYDCGIAP